MRIVSILVLACGILSLPGEICAGEYRDLFNGKDLDGWVVEGPKQDKEGNANWSVRDKTIVCLGKGFGFLRYDQQQFGNFALRVEYRFSAPPAKTNRRG